MVPTIENVLKQYAVIAVAERVKSGRPCEGTVKNAVFGMKTVCAAAGIGLQSRIDAITTQRIDAALVAFLGRGVERISAWSYVCQLRAVFARWTESYYEQCGWEIPRLRLPSFRATTQRYLRPSSDLLQRVKSWYRQLEEAAASTAATPRLLRRWFAATMMMEFAMRNGDVLRLTPANFEMRGGTAYLSYVPHKTALSSGRRVRWPIHGEIWRRLKPLVTERGTPGTSLLATLDDSVFEQLNRELRALGFAGSKASYELRKICVDHIYQKYGAEMATSISGDDIKTVSRYYADPSAVNVAGVRIVDLI